MRGLGFIVILLVALCNTAPAQDSDQPSDKFQRAVDAYGIGDYESAANIWLIEAYEGSHDAQFNLGVMYLEGKGVAQNRGEALFWFNKAAQAGHVEAQYNLGHLFVERKDDPESVSQGVDWWRQAAEQGFGIAQFNYGRALFYGVGVKKNLAAAKFWMEASKNSGLDIAENFLRKHAEVLSSIYQAQPEILPVETEVVARVDEVDKKIEAVVSAEVSENRKQEITDVVESPDKQSKKTLQPYYVRVHVDQGFVYSRFNSRAPIMGTLEKGLLLRVIAQNLNWLQVEAPGGFPGWVKKTETTRDNNFVEIVENTAQIFADPTAGIEDNLIGEVSKGTILLVFADEGDWYQVQSPESVSGWIESASVSQDSSTSDITSSIWQEQSLKRKLVAMSSRTDSSLAELVEPDTLTPAFDSFDSNIPVEGEFIKELTIDEFVSQLDESFTIKPVPTRETQLLPQFQQEFGRVVRKNVVLFNVPRETGVALFKIGKGTLVNVINIKNQWARVSIPGGLPIWLRVNSLNMAENKVVVEDEAVFGSFEPNIESQIPELGTMQKGVRMKILEINNGWIRVLAPKWVSAWLPRKSIEELALSESLDSEWGEQQSRLYSKFTAYKETPEAVIEIAEIESESTDGRDAKPIIEEELAEAQAPEKKIIVVEVRNQVKQVETASASGVDAEPLVEEELLEDQTSAKKPIEAGVNEAAEEIEIANDAQVVVEPTVKELDEEDTAAEKWVEVGVGEVVIESTDSGEFVKDNVEENQSESDQSEQDVSVREEKFVDEFTLTETDNASPSISQEPLQPTTTPDITGLEGTGLSNDNKWLFSNHPKRVTLQLFSVKDGDKAVELYRQLNGDGQKWTPILGQVA